MDRYYEWLGRGMHLGNLGELWRVVPNNPANEWLAEQDGVGDGGGTLAFYTSRTLLLDVLHAAGAIEYTVERINAASAAVQAYANKHGVRAESEDVPTGLRTPEVDVAYLEYANLLNWLRTLIDRMRSQDPYSKAKLGLIPALSQEMPLRRAVETVFDRFVRDPVIAAEPVLTNFGLHLHALPGGGTPRATMTTGGRARLLIPDKPAEPIYLFDQFTYQEERELEQFAHAVFDRVEVFVNELLAAFETGTEFAMAQREQIRAKKS